MSSYYIAKQEPTFNVVSSPPGSLSFPSAPFHSACTPSLVWAILLWDAMGSHGPQHRHYLSLLFWQRDSQRRAIRAEEATADISETGSPVKKKNCVKDWGLLKGKSAKGTNTLGGPGHSASERRHSLVGVVSHESRFKDYYVSLVHFSLIRVIMTCFISLFSMFPCIYCLIRSP